MLCLGDLKIPVPVFQGGMGVGVSLSRLAGSVAKAGGVGVISTAQIGYREPGFETNPIETNLMAIKIISGAGMPMDLPKLVEGTKVKIAPIISSLKALDILTRYWKKKYNKIPDAVIVAGGIWDRKDLEHYTSMGAGGVQIATRFVTTEECDAHESFKQAYINASKEDIVIVKSPVGMPGRAIHNKFLDRVANGERFMRGCRQCVKTCNIENAPFCITEALVNAVKGKLDEGLIFCGSNAYRCNKIETVKCIMEEFA